MKYVSNIQNEFRYIHDIYRKISFGNIIYFWSWLYIVPESNFSFETC